MVIVGIDAHKRTHTAVAIDEVGRKLGEKRTTATTTEANLDLMRWADGFGMDRRFAVEDCRHLSRHLEADLLGAGEEIVRVPPKMMARVVSRLAPNLLLLPGVGALTAAKIVAETADVRRFRSKDAFARHNGTAPLPVWSGNRVRPGPGGAVQQPGRRGAGLARAGPVRRDGGDGIEALSRGADHAVFVERLHQALATVHCILFDGSDEDNQEARARIEAMVRTTDGFELADEDLKLRGEGTLFDTKQSGMPDLKLARLAEDMDLVKRARTRAFAIIAEDPRLERHPALLDELKSRFERSIDWLFRS